MSLFQLAGLLMGSQLEQSAFNGYLERIVELLLLSRLLRLGIEELLLLRRLGLQCVL